MESNIKKGESLMFGVFLKLSNWLPAVRDIRDRSSADGGRPLWVRYESPISNPPHDRSEVQALFILPSILA